MTTASLFLFAKAEWVMAKVIPSSTLAVYLQIERTVSAPGYHVVSCGCRVLNRTFQLLLLVLIEDVQLFPASIHRNWLEESGLQIDLSTPHGFQSGITANNH